MTYLAVKAPGRPPKWETVEELQELIEKYFMSCLAPVMETVKNPEYDFDADPDDEMANDGVPKYIERQRKNAVGELLYEQVEPYTISGLAMSIGVSRTTLLQYEKELLVSFDEEKRKQFADTIKEAKYKVEEYLEKYLYTGKNQTSAIFVAKNNFGWQDKRETDITSGGEKIVGHTIEFVSQDGKQ